ncbi:MAG: helix-turn-helix transcriptional regulator [Oryzihumus sp.]
MDTRPGDDLDAAAALAEPTRRRLYDFVARSERPVGRDEAASALDLPRQTAAFHLDRLADEGLLDVRFERRTGRVGPGAGRPAKLYVRSAREVCVQLPERRYDLAGLLLAGAMEEAQASQEPPRLVLERRSRAMGAGVGAREASGSVTQALGGLGFEPAAEGEGLVLRNCPFHELAHEHTALVCGMNLHLVEGLLDGLGDTAMVARLAPQPGRCCVRLEPASREP